ncbi:acetate--CoA ligase family protein [Ancylobacter sp. MQZ15Z-1]|uniref:Acetate--CoA ligase family protein n=1 Tax=Ancylobacter mangrovi TaxID=2972472 RepID=A0A9X2PKF1_9HYPH|nr:acetate--CoA ligase family protein [Ancylobacter mangrovi]MCS0496892.1 acetate--CoA ligase family protein [Ancylobacter mangrovi]
MTVQDTPALRATSAQSLIAEARSNGRGSLDEAAGKALLAEFGIRVPRSRFAADAAQAAAMAADLEGPFVVKVVSPDILHKSDAGGVTLRLADAKAVREAVDAMAAKPLIAAARVDGWLVEEMVPVGREMVIGGYRDPQFGPMIMVGLGGIFVEVLRDVAFRICPIDAGDAEAMLGELKGRALLKGARGEAGVDEAALVDVMLRIGGADGLLMRHQADIAELDLNPVIVSSRGAVAVDARVILSPTPESVDAGPDSSASPLDTFRPLFEPRTVAVLGASTKDVAIANTFIRRMKAFGYAGQIYPIHPAAEEIEGLKAYPGLADTPEPVDYAYIAVGAERIPGILAKAGGRCRIAQVISSGFGELEEGKALQEALIEGARAGGVRVLGPNCLGTYSPRGGLTFPSDAPKEVGTVGIVSQSGGLTTDIIKRGEWRGLRFSGAVTIGNSADVKPHELLAYYLADPQTRAIGLYLEDVKQGRAFFEMLKGADKPVVILKGGRSALGRLAAASHTGALAGDEKGWEALGKQTPVSIVATVDEFIDMLLALQHFTLRPDKPTYAVTLFGNGGGSSVLGTDAFAAAGLEVAPYAPEARDRLEAMKLPPGTSVANPIDTPVRTLQEKDGFVAGEILDIVYGHADPDAVLMHLNLSAFVGRGSVDPIDNLFVVVEQTKAKWPGGAHFALALRTDGSAALDERRRHYREKARAIGVPVFDEIAPAARALAGIGHIERQLGRR